MSTPVRQHAAQSPQATPASANPAGMRADHDRQPAKRRDRAGGVLPAQSLEAGCRGDQPGQQRIGEISQDRGGHVDRLDRLEQTKDESRE
jgi:hypothetical protein